MADSGWTYAGEAGKGRILTPGGMPFSSSHFGKMTRPKSYVFFAMNVEALRISDRQTQVTVSILESEGNPIP